MPLTTAQKIAMLDESIESLYGVLEKLAVQTSVSVNVDGTSITYKSIPAVQTAIQRLENQKRWLGTRQGIQTKPTRRSLNRWPAS